MTERSETVGSSPTGTTINSLNGLFFCVCSVIVYNCKFCPGPLTAVGKSCYTGCKAVAERMFFMKKLIIWLMLACLCIVSPLSAHAEGEPQPLEMAFGLFTVDAPARAVITHTAGNMFSDLRCEIEPWSILLYANYAPTSEYEASAQKKLDSCVSMMFAVSGGDYTETEIAQERLDFFRIILNLVLVCSCIETIFEIVVIRRS